MPGALPHLGSARLVDVADMPGLAAAASRGVPAHITVRGTRLRFAHHTGGRAWEEEVTVTLGFSPSDGFIRMWWSDGFTMRAPAGQLASATPALSAAIQSVRLTRAWHAYREQVRMMFRQGLIQHQDDLRRLAGTMRQHREETRAAHHAAWEEREAFQARMN